MSTSSSARKPGQDDSQFSRALIYISLALAIALVVGVLVGAKIISERAANQPVGMSDLPSPLADSQECAELLEILPDEVLGHDRATIAEPAPDGAAAWQTSELERVTLRCGVDLPLQYTEYSTPVEIDGTQWLVVGDATPESTLATWYSINREPIVAITADDMTLDGADNPVDPLTDAVNTLPEAEHEPNPGPLAELDSVGAAAQCAPLLDAVPTELTEDYSLIDGTPSDTAVWVADGLEPVVMRCGVAPPPNYEAGQQLTQISEVPWFEDTRLVNGSTASYWYALGRETDIAVSAPMDVASDVLPPLSTLIVDTTEPQDDPA